MKFRGRALQKMREPDELDRPVALVDTRGWTALFVVMSVVLGAAIWAFTGSLPITMSAPGILTSAEGNRAVTTPAAGTIASALVQPGDQVSAGDPLLTVAGRNKTVTITAPLEGMVLTLDGALGQPVALGDAVATIQAGSADSALVAQVFVPAAEATSVRPGVKVLLEVEGSPKARFGLLKGTVASVGAFQIDPSQAAGVLGSRYTAAQLTRDRPTVPVMVELEVDEDTDSGFAWTSVDGPPFQIDPQHRVEAAFRLGDRTPFDVVLGTS